MSENKLIIKFLGINQKMIIRLNVILKSIIRIKLLKHCMCCVLEDLYKLLNHKRKLTLFFLKKSILKLFYLGVHHSIIGRNFDLNSW